MGDLPQEEQGPHLAFLERVAKEDGDFQRLRAIREYRRRHHAPPTSTKLPPSASSNDTPATPEEMLQGLILVLGDYPEPERPVFLAFLEEGCRRRGDLARLRAIKEYRRLHSPPTNLDEAAAQRQLEAKTAHAEFK